MFNVKKEDKILSNYKFIDLFCGIGGFHLALSSYGAKCVFASDINKEASEIYEQNFTIKPHGDIRKIHAKDIPSHDILCAGFPCQAFSISGNMNGFADADGKLFFETLRIIKYHKPKLIILENVRNLVSHNGGETIKVIEDRLKKSGYDVFRKVLCSNEFSVPQVRYRVYIVAFRCDLNVKNFLFPEKKGKMKCLNDILEKNIDEKYYIKKEYTINECNIIKKSNKLIRIGYVGQGRQGERIYSPMGQSTTLSSQGGGIGGKTGMYLIDNKVRKLTPRECARLMGFPDRFKIAKSDNECYKQFGNSVVVNVIQEIVRLASKELCKG